MATVAQGTTPEARKQKIALLFGNVITKGELDLADELFHEDFHWPQFDLSTASR
ncbi:hypothetical protein [Streptomyces sp. NRRL B-24484]|uniref:hypothetical protein n=1 Tax=Streptomyces sp. NRRL B-24484 TaxID=1463833 RepID=UPI001F186118|nr:hypothetical protein [Streptomyces sp. NRRL B-24484]